ncbi:MAG: hypothetical protein CL685_00380 [Candidatus Magasanikbacteria bacterium]|nr:hypothetical protein [Candidatus Magasanikbacteria bacterium]
MLFANLVTILPLACAIFVLIFGFFVVAKNISVRVNQLLFGFCLSMFFWMFGTFMMFYLGGENTQASIFWDRFVYIGVVFMPPLMHHFSIVFTRIQRQKIILRINYFLSFLFLVASRTPYFVDELFVYNWGVHTQAKILHHFFLLYFFIGTGLFFFNILKYIKKIRTKHQRKQVALVCIAFAAVIFGGGSAFLYAYGIDTHFPFAYLSGFIFPVILFYAVSKYNFLDIRVIVTEILVGATIFVLIVDIFLSKSIYEVSFRTAMVFLITLIGGSLIKSVYGQIQKKEQVSRLAKSLEKANIRLRVLDRQKTEFLSIAAHQLRTPLSIIKGYLELIKDGAYGKVEKKLTHVLTDMEESNERLVKLVDEFLNISHIEQGRTKYHFEEVDVNHIIASVVEEMADKAKKKKIKINWKSKKNIGLVYVDEDKLRNVIFNFLDNGIKYTEKGSVTITFTQKDNGVIVRIKDTGIGFDKQDEASLFTKFYRGKNVEGINVNGTGLGVYVCRQFVSAHGGYVWGKSMGPGTGSEFGFWIPKKRTHAHKITEERTVKDEQTVVNQYKHKK